MTGVEPRRHCTQAEHEIWLIHQRASNPNTGEWPLARYQERPLLGLATLTGASQIAGLTSFFKRPVDDFGSSARFTIREAVERFASRAQASTSDGLARFSKVRHYAALTERQGSAPVVTLVAFVDDIVVVDGNHTSMAAYHRAVDGSSEVALPVFILDTVLPSSVLG